MAVELRHLHAFLAVAEEGQFTRAAVRLHLSQPTITRMIRQLETDMGVVLLERTTRRVALTAAGEQLRDELAVLLPRLNLALRAHQRTATLRLGFAWGLPAGWAQSLVKRFEDQTGTRVELIRRDEPLVGVDRGDVDVAILRKSVAPPGLRAVSLFEETRAAAVANGSPLARRRYLHWHELADWPLVVNIVSGTTFPEHWPAENRPTVAIECHNFDEWLEAIAVDRGVGVLPESIASQHPHPSIRYVPIRGAPPIPVLLAYPLMGVHPLAGRFAAIAREIPLEPWLP